MLAEQTFPTTVNKIEKLFFVHHPRLVFIKTKSWQKVGKKSLQGMWHLSLSSKTEGVSSFPGSVGGATDRVDEAMSLSDATGALSLRGESAHFAMFGVALGDPLVLGVVADGVVVGVNQDHLNTRVNNVRK